MINEKKLLKIAGILNCITSLFLTFIPAYAILMLATGIFLYIESKESDEQIIHNKFLLFLIGVLGIIDLLGSLLVFIVCIKLINYRIKSNGIKAPPKKLSAKEKEIRKKNLTLNIGAILIFIAGILLLTTQTSYINSVIKSIILIISGIIFLLISAYTDLNANNSTTPKTFWYLSMSFLIFGIAEVFNSAIFGQFLSYHSEGTYLSYMITTLVISLLSLASFIRFNDNKPLFISYSTLLLSIYNLLIYFKATTIEVVTLFSLITLIINIFSSKDKQLFKFSSIISYILFFLIVTTRYPSTLIVLIASIINFININYLSFTAKDKEENIINVLLSQMLVFFALSNTPILDNMNFVLISLISGLYTLFVNSYLIPIREKDALVNYTVYALETAVLLYFVYQNQSYIGPLLITSSFIIVNLIAKRGLFNTYKIDFVNYIEPISIIGLNIALSVTFFKNLDLIYAVSFTSLIYCLIHYITKKHKTKTIYFISIITSLIVTLLTYADELNYLTALSAIVTSLYIFIDSLFTKDENEAGKDNLAISTIFLLTSIYMPFVLLNILNISNIKISLIFVIIMLLIVAFIKDKTVANISCLYVIFPLLSAINKTEFGNIITSILNSIVLLYMTYIIVSFYIKNKYAKNIIGIIGLILFTFLVFLESSIYAGIFIAIIGVIAIIIGIKNDDLYGIFIVGIIYTIINIMYRLWIILEKVPYWLYLLIAGFILVAYVLYKDLKKNK